ncbi:hypothetical protein HMPREF1861_02160 [Corynebacterium kroppenstedtii]|nr:hypothetical protein HMPREF1861_02160 [Corynebacterium kroppenstedtii]
MRVWLSSARLWVLRQLMCPRAGKLRGYIRGGGQTAGEYGQKMAEN